MKTLLEHPDLRKIVYKPKERMWHASFYGKEITVDGRKTREKDIKCKSKTLEGIKYVEIHATT